MKSQEFRLTLGIAPRGLGAAARNVSRFFGLNADDPGTIDISCPGVEVGPGQIVLLMGPSGSGKSSILRHLAPKALDANRLAVPDEPLIEQRPGPLVERLCWWGQFGLGDPKTVLRTPQELSEGQLARVQLAQALSRSKLVCVDEFGATLDRVTAQVLSYNLRRVVDTLGTTLLVATSQGDLQADLQPNSVIHCRQGRGLVEQRVVSQQPISWQHELTIGLGTLADWHALAGWHYRNHRVAFVKRVIKLRHHEEVVGVAVFCAPAAGLRLRAQYLGIPNLRTAAHLQALNQQLWVLSRVVLDPRYRGAGLGAWFIDRACRLCPVPYIECLSALGHCSTVFDRAGFERVGIVAKPPRKKAYGSQYGRKKPGVAPRTVAVSQFNLPVYFVRDNRNGQLPLPAESC